MKILYVFDSQDHEVFKMSDLPDRFEIIREGKKPIVFKPVTIQIQDIHSRLDEAEALLKDVILQPFDSKAIDEYFDRYSHE